MLPGICLGVQSREGPCRKRKNGFPLNNQAEECHVDSQFFPWHLLYFTRACALSPDADLEVIARAVVMPSPSEIQDSDGEEGVSPAKVPEINLHPDESFFDGIGSSEQVIHNGSAEQAPSPSPSGKCGLNC